ncbi:MAG TPA: histidine phosphatase family protein [Acidimicrobiales bacterium]|jgi:probable phosphoglycerate mutase
MNHEVVIVRHGRTDANARRLLAGRINPPLDTTGWEQVRRVAARLTDVDRVITSPLDRARQTAEVIAEAACVDTIDDSRWIELDYGDWDGRAIDDVTKEEWAAFRGDPTFAPPGGESLSELSERVGQALGDLASHRPVAGVTVVVTHVSPVKAAVAWSLGAGPELTWRIFVANASITQLSLGPSGALLRSFNDTGHLEA